VSERWKSEEVEERMERRKWLMAAVAGSLVTALGGTYVLAADNDPRTKQKRKDGRIRLPPGQRLLHAMKPMGGTPGSASPGSFRLKIHGEVDAPMVIDFAQLLAMPQTKLKADVHCVTGWSCFDVPWQGVQVAHLAKLAKVKKTARHVIFEAAHGYTCNVRLKEALAPNVMVAHKVHGKAIPRPHGPPVRGLVPDLYFWKSAKWLTGIRFVRQDDPGYWETRGYHNHADPWREERYG
jgi:DMSO/TMAO reductase YedYZ molybdopterin-dependent catalytic subunit